MIVRSGGEERLLIHRRNQAREISATPSAGSEDWELLPDFKIDDDLPPAIRESVTNCFIAQPESSCPAQRAGQTTKNDDQFF